VKDLDALEYAMVDEKTKQSMLKGISETESHLRRLKKLYRALWGDLPGTKKKKPRKDDEKALAWIAEYREWAPTVGWPAPNGGMQGAYRDCQNQVRLQGAEWPSWETLTRGVRVIAEKWSWKPSDPYWLLAKKKVEDGYYPNILKVVNAAGPVSPQQPRFRDIKQ
jgi:hypothetical protein